MNCKFVFVCLILHIEAKDLVVNKAARMMLYCTILASLFQTEVFAQWDESERLHTSFDLMHVNEKIDSGSVDSVPFFTSVRNSVFKC